MIQSDILDQLERIVEDARPRRDQSIYLAQTTVEARSKAALGTLRATVLPRIILFTNDQDDAVTLTVNNGRVADMTEAMMDGEPANLRDTTAEHVAQMLNMVCSGSGIQIFSTPPENEDDIAATGLQISKIEAAINALEPVTPTPAQTEPPVSVEAEPADDTPAVQAPAAIPPAEEPAANDDIGDGIAAQFYANSKKASDQRILVNHADATVAGPDGVLTQNIDAVQQLMDDLSAWDADSDQQDVGPQLIILRSQGQDMPSLTICRDTNATAMAAHHTRRLGSVVQLWKSLTAHENLS